ncbi:hypothetical protein [Thalassococcus sp. BH17M4-6]|uniref:hypothetical protein n=1 Tax=Thalassococcus sp. BH17M4-6 TaxID=3413148 RepID=UPI003BF6073D
MESGIGSGMVLAMTDLFFSTSAVLLIAIALSEQDVPVQIPIQADLFALCPPATDTPGPIQIMPAMPVKVKDGEIEPFDTSGAIPVPTKEALAEALAELSEALIEQPLVTVTLLNVKPHKVTSPCLLEAKTNVFGAYNLWLSELTDKPGLPPVGTAMSPVGLEPIQMKRSDARQ